MPTSAQKYEGYKSYGGGLLTTFTHADGSSGVRVCTGVCLSACLSVCLFIVTIYKTNAAIRITKLDVEMVYHESWLEIY